MSITLALPSKGRLKENALAQLEKAGLTIDDIDVFEINEAFASQACFCA